LDQGNIVHQYLYANLVEMVEQKDLDEFRYRQVIVNDEVPGTKSFTPEDLNKIIAFVNQNSNIFKK
jgi:hypothetical protein